MFVLEDCEEIEAVSALLSPVSTVMIDNICAPIMEEIFSFSPCLSSSNIDVFSALKHPIDQKKEKVKRSENQRENVIWSDKCVFLLMAILSESLPLTAN